MNLINIKSVESKEKLREIFTFLSKSFYEDALSHKEHYFIMSERYEEMKEQYKKDKELIIYIEEAGNIVGALTSKNMDLKSKKITLGVMVVAESHRKRGYARSLIQEFEKACKEKGIAHIDLGARFRACPFYINQGYKPKLMVQVFDFAGIEDIKKANIEHLEIEKEYQGETYGFIIFNIDGVDKGKINYFERNVPTAQAQYVFEKDL
ncbi:MAG: GNAT family N-acetyltransferase [Bacilli bacterium]|nr:GNAT family N-acetyltransferase [Bacilli bacterium]